MKKLISIILTAIMLLSAVVTVSAASFRDVKSSDWYYSSVNYVVGKGIMNGTSSTRFSPNQPLTRAMGVTLLYRVAGSPSVSGSIPFTDVKNGQWYTNAVKWAYKNGIVTGKSDTFFHTNGNITRAEFATILNRFSTAMKYQLPLYRVGQFTDSSKIPSWATVAVNTMYQAEIINGRSDGRFDPNAKISRAEAASMIERFDKAPKNSISSSGSSDKPVTNETVPTTGKLVIKEKKYAYGSVDVMILNVENQTNTAINVTFTGKFMDASGKELKSMTKIVNGFSANYRNYIAFEPGIKFDKFTVETKITKCQTADYMKYLAFDPTPTSYTIRKMSAPDLLGLYEKYPAGQERLGFYFSFKYSNSTGKDGSQKTKIKLTADLIIIDNHGNLYDIINYNGAISPGQAGYKNQMALAEHIIYDNWKKPANFELSMLVGLKTLSPMEASEEEKQFWD